MLLSDIARQRLWNQRLSGQPFSNPAAGVDWLVAVQSQDYANAKWGLAIRSQGLTDSDFDQAFNDGVILRTHVMRPTWHFVLPADIRWLLMLTAPRVHAANAYYYRKMELDDALFRRSHQVLEQALKGGNHLTRDELAARLAAAGIKADRLRLAYIIMHAELEALVCSGPRKGKQFTYALLEERARQMPSLTREEALAQFIRRFFTSRGPATVNDFSKWSGLTIADAKAGLEMVKSSLISKLVEGQTYWLAPSEPAVQQPSPTAYLLPNYDEYVSSYADYRGIFDPEYSDKMNPKTEVVFAHFILMDGLLVGTWKRTLQKRTAIIEMQPFTPFSEAEHAAILACVQRYSEFLGLPVVLQ